MQSAHLRPDVVCEEMPAPQRIAPYAAAITADVTFDGDDLGTGRLVLLHDPAGNDAWEGTFRWVAYVRADIDLEMANDPLLGAVGWSWLQDALSAHQARHHAPSGTVTKVSSEPFGEMEGGESTAQLEIRASWTPDGTTLRTTWRRGASCSAPPPGCPRSRPESPRFPIDEDSAASGDDRPDPRPSGADSSSPAAPARRAPAGHRVGRGAREGRGRLRLRHRARRDRRRAGLGLPLLAAAPTSSSCAARERARR